MKVKGLVAGRKQQENRKYSCLVLPDHITALVLLNPTMKLINDLAMYINTALL